MKNSLLVSVFFVIISCNQNPRTTESYVSENENLVRYAEKFRLNSIGEITVTEPWPGATEPVTYQIDKSPKRIVVTSTTHLPFLELLGVEDRLVGFPGTHYISSERIREQVESGEITDLGSDGQINLELLIAAAPDLVVSFDMGQQSANLDKIVEAGIPVFYNADFLETTTLGRAEWIKFFGAVFGLMEKADSIFTEIEYTYQSFQKLAASSTSSPSVFSGVMYGDAWFLPGGNNWSAQFIRDAGGRYLWGDDPSNGWLEVSFESVLSKAQNSDYWIGTATLKSLDELGEADERYRLFDAYQQGRVYSYSKRINEYGGFDFFEMGNARPDLVLADLIHILHPELLPDYESYFFEALP